MPYCIFAISESKKRTSFKVLDFFGLSDIEADEFIAHCFHLAQSDCFLQPTSILGTDVRSTKMSPKGALVGIGYDISINERAQTIENVIDYQGDISFDNVFTSEAPSKSLDRARVNPLSWEVKVDLEIGLKKTHKTFFNTNTSLLRKFQQVN